ncbi:MAG TPA: hypothetical protein VN408_20790 [Actinoplanes sp.]|nr:hypothetical protein [Actinoplanes sp.]
MADVFDSYDLAGTKLANRIVMAPMPARLAAGGPHNTPEKSSFFGGDHRGYTDYPTLAG